MKAVYACEGKSLVKYFEDRTVLNNDIVDDVTCINYLASSNIYDEKFTGDLPIPVEKIKRNSGILVEPKILKQIPVFSDPGSSVCNDGDEKQTGNTPSRIWSKTETTDWTVSPAAKFSSKGKIGIPFVAEGELGFEFNLGVSYKTVKTDNKQVKAESQKVDVKPRQCIDTTYVLYETEALYTHYLDFELEQTGENGKRFEDIRSIVQGNKDPDQREFHFYNNETGFFVDFSGDTTVLRYVPVTQVVNGYKAKVLFGKNYPIPNVRSGPRDVIWLTGNNTD